MSISKYINSCNLFIGLYSAYMLFKAKDAGALSGTLLLLLVIVSFGYYIYVQFKITQPKLLKYLSYLFAFFAIYGLFYIISGEVIKDYSSNSLNNIDYIKNIAISLLPVYPFYVYTKQGKLNLKTIYSWIPIFLLLSIYTYFQYYNTQLARAIANGSSVTEFTNNNGYLFLSLLPIIFLKYKSKLLQLTYILITLLFILAAVKRGAILIAAICIVYYLYQTIFKEKVRGNSKFKIILVVLIAVLIGGYYIVDFVSKNEYFAYRLANTLEGNVSGRDDIYSGIWNIFLNSSLFNVLFGHGANSSVRFIGMYAHNDWLEILINQGIFGIIIYMGYFIVMYKTWKKYHVIDDINLCLSALVFILFFKTLFSMSYTGYTLYLCIAYGYVLGYISNMKRLRHVKRA